MANLLTYIIQVNVLLAFVYLGYFLLLKGLTFYKINRIYLLLAGLYAFLYPLLDVNSWFEQQADLSIPIIWTYVPGLMEAPFRHSIFTVDNMVVVAISIGLVVLLLRLLLQFFSLMRIHYHSRLSHWQHYIYRNVFFPIAPFSFLNKIYVHKEQHCEPELYDIFEHEYIHVKGLHTIDVLLFEIIWIVCWYNPLVWLMRKAVRQNLEFLTDQQVLNAGVDRQTYQYSLLRVTKRGAAVGIGNQFNFKILKKRIMMMNKRRSSRLELSKYVFLLPIMLFVGASFTMSKADPAIQVIVDKAKNTDLEKVIPLDPVMSVNMKGEVGDFLKEVLGTSIINIDTSKSESKNGIVVIGHKTRDLSPSNGGALSLDMMQERISEEQNILYVIDGKEMPKGFDMNWINKKDIESVSVLKDAAATAIYGERGKSGVIQIVMKKKLSDSSLKSEAIGLRVEGHRDTTRGQMRTWQIINLKIKDLDEIPKDKNYFYIYDDKVVSKEEFYNLNDRHQMLIISDRVGLGKIYGDRVDNIDKYDGMVKGNSSKELERQKDILVIVDGKEMPRGFDMKAINPNDIASVDILKNASSVAAYGERGKSGVIQITMKKKADDKESLSPK